jgi:tetratricopeptide (TPR) repeat protein
LRLYERAGDDDVLREAEDTIRAAVAGLRGHPDRGVGLANLCMILTKRADRTGDLTLFQEAVRYGRESLTAMPPGDRDRGIGLADLSLALCLSGELTGDLAALREAEHTSREAVDSAPATDPQRGLYLDILGIALRIMYERTGDLALLRDAVAAHHAAVDAVASGQPARAPFLANLSVALSLLFQATGDPAALRDATRAGHEAVAAGPTGDPEHAGRTMHVSTGLLLAAERVGEEAVLREALRVAQDAVARIPASHALHARFLINLANGLSALFVRTGAITALHEAMAASRAAVAAIPPDHLSYRAVALFGLARVQLRYYRHTADVTALREAARASTDAVAAIPRGHHREPRILGMHSHVLMTMVEHTGDAATLREAVRIGQQVLAGLPLDHFDRVTLLVNMAIAHGRLSEDIEARRLLTAAAAITTAPAAQRIHAARNAADRHLHAGDHPQAVEAVELALELLPQLASRDLARADWEYGVAATAGLASTAAAVFLAAGQPDRAVEALEQTRGLVLAGTLDIRDEHADLRAHAPELADEFDDLCRALDAADHNEGVTSSQRAELNRRWHELLARIRLHLPGFLRPQSIDELRLAGPIVYVTAHNAAGHALIVNGERPVRVVTLPGLTNAAATALVAMLGRSDMDLLGVLGWLWDVVAWPVLRELGYTEVPSGAWPRIWWCPVGVVTFLPLHAAGHHMRAADTVLDHAISSYTPTLRALAHARARHPRHKSMVVVAVPDTPGTTPLAYVTEEARAISALVPGATLLPPAGTTTTRDMVMKAMEQHQIVHFACHGIADLTNPPASRLLLHDHRTSPLTLHTVTGLRLTDAYLAYLSACSTTDTSPVQADEATHLTAAFHLAGYRNVIGTLWPIDDQVAKMIAEDFHAQHTDPAEALHHALHRYRANHRERPRLWAAYVHTGT